MRGAARTGVISVRLLGTGLVALLMITGCERAGVRGGTSPASVRAERRAFDGAPPVIPHGNVGATCTECHNERGVAVEDVGFAPPSPHENTMGMSNISRCRQCHVSRETDDMMVANSFVGLRQDLRRGRRLNPMAPPTIPHKILMRQNCAACHTGEAAREEIRTSHPERIRCRQCHVPVTTRGRFEQLGDEGGPL